jgi:uncharacterized membrane protein YciS (DUF1049 family)
MNNKITSHITKGLIIAAVLSLLDLAAGIWDFKLTPAFRWVPMIVLSGSLIWACVSFGAQNNYTESFGNLFAHGFKTTAVVGCIFVIYTLLAVLVIFPGTKDIALEEARKQMERKGDVSEENIKQGLAITRRFFIPFTIAGSLFGTILVGAMASLIGAAVTKKKPQSPF